MAEQIQTYYWKVADGFTNPEKIEETLENLNRGGWEIFAILPSTNNTTRIIARRPDHDSYPMDQRNKSVA